MKLRVPAFIKLSDELYDPKPAKWTFADFFTLKTFAVLLSPLVVALLGAASRGDIFLYLVLAWANWDKLALTGDNAGLESLNEKNSLTIGNDSAPMVTAAASDDVIRSDLDEFLHNYRMDNIYFIVPAAIMVSFVFFFGIGGYLQWHYYIKRRDVPETWKCQPKRFLKKEDERHEVLLGMSNLILGSTISGICAAYIMNGGNFSRLYYNVSDYGWLYFIFTTVATFLYQDAVAYYIHRMLHSPFLYKNFHKMHHRYHSPTAFSAVAMHPVEFTWLQLALALPMFLVPLHFLSFLGCVFYIYYYGMIDHSGIDFEAVWPWQPPVRFHDDHHKYFHVNFGFNTLLFDRFHDTLRKKTRVYSEKIFGGKGVQETDGAKKNN